MPVLVNLDGTLHSREVWASGAEAILAETPKPQAPSATPSAPSPKSSCVTPHCICCSVQALVGRVQTRGTSGPRLVLKAVLLSVESIALESATMWGLRLKAPKNFSPSQGT